MDTKSRKCGICCNPDFKINNPCCDCSKDDQECVWIQQKFKTEDNEPTSNGPIRSVSALAVTLVTVGILIFMIVVAVGVFLGIRVHQSWRAPPYALLSKDPLEIMDNDSGSEFESELYAKA